MSDERHTVWVDRSFYVVLGLTIAYRLAVRLAFPEVFTWEPAKVIGAFCGVLLPAWVILKSLRLSPRAWWLGPLAAVVWGGATLIFFQLAYFILGGVVFVLGNWRPWPPPTDDDLEAIL